MAKSHIKILWYLMGIYWVIYVIFEAKWWGLKGFNNYIILNDNNQDNGTWRCWCNSDKDEVKNHAILVPWKIDHENLGKWKW